MPISRSLKPSTQHNPVVFAWNDFSGGLNADYANYPLALSENELAEILNYRYVKQGGLVKLRSRDGLTKANTTGAGAAVNDYYHFTTSAGVEYDVVVADSDLKYLNAGAFTKIGDLASTRGRTAIFNDKLIIADGGILKYWDGTSYLFLKDDNDYLLDNVSSQTPIDSTVGLYTGSYLRFGAKYTTPDWEIDTFFYTLTVTFAIRKANAPTGSVLAKIYKADGTLVDTSDAGYDVATDITTSLVNKTFTFTNLQLSPATAYYVAIVFTSTSSDSSNMVVVGVINYVNNNCVKYDASWSDVASTCYIRISPNVGPLASFVIQKRNRIYCNSSVNPNRLYFCNANDPNDWSTVNGAGYIIFDGHYKLNGAYVYNNSIYVFADQPKAVYRLTGDSPLEYAIQDQPLRGVTAISQDVIQDVGSDLIFQDSRGIISLRSLVETGDIEKSIISKDKVNRTYVLPYTSQVSGKNVTDNQYWLTTTGNYVLVYDQELGCWTRFQFELGTSVTPTCFGINSGITYIGDSAGNLWYMDYTKTQDNGVDFSLIAKPAWTDFGVLFDKDARFADCVVISANQETYDLEIYINMNTATPLKTLSLVSLSQNGAYQSPYCGNLNEVNFNFKQIQAKVTAIASGTGPHWLDRIVIEAAVLSHY